MIKAHTVLIGVLFTGPQDPGPQDLDLRPKEGDADPFHHAIFLLLKWWKMSEKARKVRPLSSVYSEITGACLNYP